MKTHPEYDSVKRVEADTFKMLDDIGLPYKQVSRYEWVPEVGTAAWVNESREKGFIKVYYGCDAEAIAHEIGHGFHERLREARSLPHPFRQPQDGEAVAEAIRFFVEQRRGSLWRPQQDKQTLEFCNYDYEKFKEFVRKLCFDMLISKS